MRLSPVETVLLLQKFLKSNFYVALVYSLRCSNLVFLGEESNKKNGFLKNIEPKLKCNKWSAMERGVIQVQACERLPE